MIVSEIDKTGVEWRKYPTYHLDTDRNQNDKAKEIRLCDFSRPHMRAFHLTWWCFFIAFFIWFSITPLLPSIAKSLNLSKKELWTSSLASVGGTIVIRFLLGPLCDKYGARTLFSIILCTTAIPTACTGLVETAQGLVLVRLLIGLAGGTFVMCEYWSSIMFANEIVGTANALVAGWGNLGAGMTHMIIGSALFPLFKYTLLDHDDGDIENATAVAEEQAWRYVCIVPAMIGFVSGIVVFFISDDCPKGNYCELKKHGAMKEVSVWKSFVDGANNRNSWILFLQYACCFGVELTMNNAASMYFRDEFGQTTEVSSAIASIFGWMNLFARGLGGFLSDYLNYTLGMKGRLLAQFVCLFMEGLFVLVFAETHRLGSSIFVMVIFSLFVQAAEGTSYGIVPYVNPTVMGAVSGIVGAGGNVGAVCFGLGFRQLNYVTAFHIMGSSIICSAFLTFLLRITDNSPSLLDQLDEELKAFENYDATSSKRPKGDVCTEP